MQSNFTISGKLGKWYSYSCHFLDIVQCMIWQAKGQEKWLVDDCRKTYKPTEKEWRTPFNGGFQKNPSEGNKWDSNQRYLWHVRITDAWYFKSISYFCLGARWKCSFPLKQNLVLLSWNLDIGSESSRLSASINRSLQKQFCYFVLNVCTGVPVHEA